VPILLVVSIVLLYAIKKIKSSVLQDEAVITTELDL
jgi:hypothetical protein